MKHSKTKDKIKQILTIINNNYGVGNEFSYSDLRDRLDRVGLIFATVVTFIKAGVVIKTRRGYYVLTEYKSTTVEKVYQYHNHKGTVASVVIKPKATTESDSVIPFTKPQKVTAYKQRRTRRISDKYITEQYEKRGLGKKGFWQKLVSAFTSN